MANPLDEHYLSKTIFAKDVESPCVRNCCLDDFDVCVGCKRTLKEILGWGSASPEEKDQILNRIREQDECDSPFADENPCTNSIK